ncbi:hypothetical protein [Promicromonospora sp. NPDC050249]|uniref:hypothetical protein n=1 Tax=Promicromonospora sp. NPDC050249 TaxID=3154743 RepID=UPI00340D9EDC
MLVVPGIRVYRLAAGDPEEAGAWGLSSLTCLFVAFMPRSALINSARDNHQLRRSGVPGTAEILSVDEHSVAAVLRILADGLEALVADAVFSGGHVRAGARVDVVVDPSDRLFVVTSSTRRTPRGGPRHR